MKYQLVLQWPASSIKDYDDLISFEEVLIKCLDKFGKVDGHDAGSSEINIFIYTDYPEQAFIQIKHILGSKDFLIDLRAAYRDRRGSDYKVLWPIGSNTFSIS